ncbi:MAG: hypothetical protein FJZ64_01785 [Chlamydiae bacterium]|nr:hypothetical protein [Chlamydiota bacterium]
MQTLESIESYLSDLLKDDPEEQREQNYVKALQGIGIDGIRSFILNLLENGIPSSIVENSYFHPNKFFKLGICRLSNCVKLRLHFWNKDQLEAKTPIHSHAWDYASLLITGSYLHDTFDVIDLEKEAVEKLKGTRSKVPENYFSLYKIPKRDSSQGKFQPQWEKYVRAERRSRRIENGGSVYFLSMEHPHQITIDLKEVGSMITLVLTSVTNRENLFTLQPLFRSKAFDNPAPNVNEETVRKQLELILNEIPQFAV